MENENNRLTPEEETANAEGTEISVEPMTQSSDADEIPVTEESDIASAPAEDEACPEEPSSEENDAESVQEEEAPAAETPAGKFSRKCAEIKKNCLATADRILHDLKETDCNPYIRQTHTCKVEIFRNAQEETPIDVFEKEETKSFSARSLALAVGVALLVGSVANHALRKVLWK